MKIILLANLSANGCILIGEQPGHQVPQEALSLSFKTILETGNLVLGRKTWQFLNSLPGGINQLLPAVTTVVISSSVRDISGEVIVVSDVRHAVHKLAAMGYNEVIVGGGSQVFNSFLQADLVTEMRYNILPFVTASGDHLMIRDTDIRFRLVHCDAASGDFLQLHYERLSNER